MLILFILVYRMIWCGEYVCNANKGLLLIVVYCSAVNVAISFSFLHSFFCCLLFACNFDALCIERCWTLVDLSFEESTRIRPALISWLR